MNASVRLTNYLTRMGVHTDGSSAVKTDEKCSSRLPVKQQLLACLGGTIPSHPGPLMPVTQERFDKEKPSRPQPLQWHSKRHKIVMQVHADNGNATRCP